MQNIYKNLHSNQKIVIYEMLKRGIEVEVFDEEREIVKAILGNHVEYLYDRDSSIMPYNLSIIAGDKGMTKRILQDAGISVPLGLDFNANQIDNIMKAFHIIGTSCVLKPVYGSHGYDVYTNLKTEDDIVEALAKIIKHRGLDTKVLIEEYFDAKEYRLFITKNRDYAVLNRDPASIIGDGKSTIKELIDEENYKRMHPRTNALCEIFVDEELYSYMNKVGLSMDMIPEKNQKVYLRPNSNVAMGGLCIDYTDRTHPSVIDVGMRVLEAFQGLPYVGIDYMTNNISEEQNDDSYRIIEINTIPGVHMHFRPAIGKSQNIAKYMVDLIFPETKDLIKDKEKTLTRF